jgi:hypothetical protein
MPLASHILGQSTTPTASERASAAPRAAGQARRWRASMSPRRSRERRRQRMASHVLRRHRLDDLDLSIISPLRLGHVAPFAEP